jgi:glutathione synthase/RimK-type ligase-like ATP-grasp enzyme
MGQNEQREKVGIIYDGNGKESWDISYFRELFEGRGVGVVLFDANQIGDDYSSVRNPEDISMSEIESLTQGDCVVWMNRVYPSEATPTTINKSLNMVSWLNSRNIVTINPLTACAADYDKFFAYQLMKRFAVPTPQTERLTPETDLEQVLHEFSLPLIIKRNTGGKGIGVIRVDDPTKLSQLLADPKFTSGRYLVQQFMESVRGHDVRVGVIDGEPLISYGRTLIPKNGERPWMASCYYGSTIIPHQASEEEKHLAVLASKAIGANLNEVDIQLIENGPVVIENNPTPGYGEGEQRWVRLIVDHIFKSHIPQNVVESSTSG